MAELNGCHQAKVMKDAFSSTEAQGFFHRGREKIKGAALLGGGLGGKGQGPTVALVPAASRGKKGKTVLLPDPLCAPAYPCSW